MFCRFGIIALVLALPVFALAQETSTKTDALKSAEEKTVYYKNQGFELHFHGEAHFSGRYVKNKNYFAIQKGVDSIDVLVDENNDQLKEGVDPNDAQGVQKLSDGGVLGNYRDNFVLGNGVKFSIHAKNQPKDSLAYGTSAEVNLQTDATRSLVTNYAYMFLETQYGRFEAGNYKSPADSMKLDASSVATIDGGITNNWIFSANIEGRHINARFEGTDNDSNARHRNVQRPFYTLPYLYTGYHREYIGGGYKAKSTYYSPEYHGLTFGFSYTKEENDILPFNDNGLEQKLGYKDIITGGVMYKGGYENLKYKISVVGEKSLSNEIDDLYFDLNGFNIGAVAQYAGFGFAASFADVFKSGLPKNLKLDKNLKQSFDDSVADGVNTNPGDTIYWTLGTSYEIGPAMASLTYMHSKTDPVDKNSQQLHENTLNVVSLGSHYHLSGKRYKFTPYIAYNYFTTQEGDIYQLMQKEESNSGYVLLGGVKVTY